MCRTARRTPGQAGLPQENLTAGMVEITDTLRVALVSLDQKWEDKGGNLTRCEEFAGRAKAYSANLVIFPEMTLTGFSMNTAAMAEEGEDAPTLKQFCDLARASGIAIIFGMAYRREGRAENTLFHVSPQGEVLARYVKMHSFSFAGEDRQFAQGDRLVMTRIGPFTVGYSICYDLRFPELYSALARQCNFIVNIANWPQRRVRHWRTLLQARAIENQVYMAGVNRTGKDGNGLAYEKSSLLFNANGDVLEPVHAEPEMDVYEISADKLEEFRQQFNTRKDRTPELYRTLI